MSKQPKFKIDNARLTRLVAKAQNGNEKALEEVINMVSGYLYYYSLTLLGNEEQAKDAVQDILLTMLKKLDTLADPKAFLGWLKTITSNYCKTKCARTKENISLDEGTWELADENDQICPAKSAETEEACGYVREAVRSLPQVLRESVMMFYFHQMSIRQIADVLEVNENTVKSRLYSARQNMKKYLEQYGGAALASCAVPLMSLLSFSLIDGAERQKGILIPYVTSAGAVKVAAVNSAASGAASVKIAAAGIACLTAIGGVSVVLLPVMSDEKRPPAPSVTTTAEHRLAEPATTTAPSTYANASDFTTAATVPPAMTGIGAQTAAATVPTAITGTGAQTAPTQAQQNAVQTVPVSTTTPNTTATVPIPPTAAASVTVPAAQRKVYIDTSGFRNFRSQPFCHIVDTDRGASFYEWSSRSEYCTHVSGSLYSYDLNALNLQDNTVYLVSFGLIGSNSTEELEFTTADYGAVMLVEVNPIYANPDSNLNLYLAKWK